MQARINTLISEISKNMYEREQIIALSLLAGIAGMNTFLYGLPGTCKEFDFKTHRFGLRSAGLF